MAARLAEVSDVVALWAAAGDLDPALVESYLDTARAFVSTSTFRDWTSQAHAFAALHFLAQDEAAIAAGAEGEAGQVVAEANGPSSRSYAAPSAMTGAEGWDSTSWGRRFLILQRRMTAARPGLLGRSAW